MKIFPFFDKFFFDKKSNFLILIKQTIHLLDLNTIKKLLFLSKKNLTNNGKILIFTLDTNQNELPTFKLMKKKLKKSLERDKKILEFISKLYPQRLKKKFIYKVKIIKKKYLEMIEERYISILLSLNNKQISIGLKEIDSKYKKTIRFKDRLTCIVL